MDKQLIRSRFSKAVDSYHKSAAVQKRIAHKMIRLIGKKIGLEHRFLLEVGCGTGFFSRLLSQDIHSHKMVLNDISPEMKGKVTDILNENNSFLCGDAETIDFPHDIDLIASCSTIQWFGDLDAFFYKCHHSLNDDGFLAFASFGKENMKEISILTNISLEYYSKIELEEKLIEAGFEIIYSEENTIKIRFETPFKVLYHLKETGVTGITNYSWNKEKLRRFIGDYNALFRDQDDVLLTFNPVFIIAKKNLNEIKQHE